MKKDKTVMIILILVLVFGIFISNTNGFEIIKYQFIGITGKAVSNCPEVKADELRELEKGLEERARVVGKVLPWPTSRYTSISVDNAEKNLNFIVPYYWELDTNFNGEERKHYEPIRAYNRDEIENLVLKNNPELQKLDPSCDDTKIKKLQKSIKYLNWIWLPTCCAPSLYDSYYTAPKENTFYWRKGFTRKGDSGISESFDNAWNAAIYRYNNVIAPGEFYDASKGEHLWGSRTDNIAAGCEVANFGAGQWHTEGYFGAQRYYRECTLKNLDFSGLPFEPKEVRIYYGLARCDGFCNQMVPEGKVQIGDFGSYAPTEKEGDYLVSDFELKEDFKLKGFEGDVRISAGLISDELNPIYNLGMGDDTPSYSVNSIKSGGFKHVRGINENFVFRGFVVSPFGECMVGGGEGATLRELDKNLENFVYYLQHPSRRDIMEFFFGILSSKMTMDGMDPLVIANSRETLNPFFTEDLVNQWNDEEVLIVGTASSLIMAMNTEGNKFYIAGGVDDIRQRLSILKNRYGNEILFINDKGEERSLKDVLSKASLLLGDMALLRAGIIPCNGLQGEKINSNEHIIKTKDFSFYIIRDPLFSFKADGIVYNIESSGVIFNKDIEIIFKNLENDIGKRIYHLEDKEILDYCVLKKLDSSSEIIGISGGELSMNELDINIPEDTIIGNISISAVKYDIHCVLDKVQTLEDVLGYIDKFKNKNGILKEALVAIELWKRRG